MKQNNTNDDGHIFMQSAAENESIKAAVNQSEEMPKCLKFQKRFSFLVDFWGFKVLFAFETIRVSSWSPSALLLMSCIFYNFFFWFVFFLWHFFFLEKIRPYTTSANDFLWFDLSNVWGALSSLFLERNGSWAPWRLCFISLWKVSDMHTRGHTTKLDLLFIDMSGYVCTV